MFSPVALGLLSLLLLPLYYAGRAVYYVYFHPLRKIPGPRLMAASRFPYIWHIYFGTLNETVHEAHKKYGEVVRIAPNELSFTSGETAWQDIYGFHSAKSGKGQYLKDYMWYNPAPNGQWHIVGAPSMADHSRHRRVLAHGFSDKALRQQESILQYYVDLLVQRLREQCEGQAQGKVDMAKWYNFATFDIMGDLTFGDSFHSLENSNYHPFIAMISQGAVLSSAMNLVMRYYPATKMIRDMLGLGTPEAKRQQLAKFVADKVEQRAGLETMRPDFYTYATRHEDEEGLGLSKGELQSNMFIVVIAGSETTATTLAGVTYMLSRHPAKLRRLQDEVRSQFSSQADITIDAVTDKCPYLIAVLQEGLRYYPPVPTGFPRKVPAGGDIISGYYVPEATSVYVSQYATNHSSRNFKQPDEWIPERWLEGNEEFADDKRTAVQPFSFGPRNCIGKNLAYAELRLVVAKMVWSFDWELMPESKDWMMKQKVFLVWNKPPLMMRLRPVVRKEMSG